MNTPFGNSITTAEHAIALMFALARQLPAADASTQAGKWEKNRFMGVEVTGKTLGIIGCGNIGSIVASRGLGLKMRVVAFDPFLSVERAAEIGVEKVELDDLLKRADFITLHTPMTAQTKNILSAENLAKTKKGVRIINCARGGLVDEVALRAALDSGHVAGAAFDVFVEEPATANPLFGHPNVVATPHLGASTSEAQENVALQVAEQMRLPGARRHHQRGQLPLDHRRGSDEAEADHRPRRSSARSPATHRRPDREGDDRLRRRGRRAEDRGAELGGDRRAAPAIAAQTSTSSRRPRSGAARHHRRGATRAARSDYENLVALVMTTAKLERGVGGTIYHDSKPRVLSIKGIKVDPDSPVDDLCRRRGRARLHRPLASLLGEAGVDIATSPSAATGRAVRRSRWSRSTAPRRTPCWPKSRSSPASSRRRG